MARVARSVGAGAATTRETSRSSRSIWEGWVRGEAKGEGAKLRLPRSEAGNGSRIVEGLSI